MTQLLVNSGQGMKNRFRLKESDFYNIPSIKYVFLGNQPLVYEAYVYLIKDIITGMKYIGIHKKTDKVYWTSMLNMDGLKILQGDEKRIEYKILAYGNYGVMKNFEADLIDKHDAVKSPEFWNQMRGMYHTETHRPDMIMEIVLDMENGKYPIQEELVSFLNKIPSWQIRKNEYNHTHLAIIKGRIKESGGSNKNTNPIIIIENR